MIVVPAPSPPLGSRPCSSRNAPATSAASCLSISTCLLSPVMFSVVSAALIAFSRPVISSFDDVLAHDGRDVVGLLQMLVVLQHHPAVRVDDARRREEQADVDRAAVERRDGQRAADVQRLEAPEHHAVRVLQPDGAERTCRTLGRATQGQGAGDGRRLARAGRRGVVVPTRPARARDDAEHDEGRPEDEPAVDPHGSPFDFAQGSRPDPRRAGDYQRPLLRTDAPAARTSGSLPVLAAGPGSRSSASTSLPVSANAPSVASASSATSTAPAVVIVRSPCWKPSTMYRPSPPPAINAASVAVATTCTAEMRMPVTMTAPPAAARAGRRSACRACPSPSRPPRCRRRHLGSRRTCS